MAVLGIDIGGTNTKCGVVDPSGELITFQKMPTEAFDNDPAPYLERLAALIDQVRDGHNVTGIGVSMHGMLNEEGSGALVCNNTPSLRGFNMQDWLKSCHHLPVVVNNDLTAHALAEYYFGSGRWVKRFMCLALGTGLGAGVIIAGKPLRFLGGRAGDNGRIIIDPDGPLDVYGARGSAEGLCGTAGIERLALQQYGRPVAAHEVIAAAREGTDRIAVQIIEQIGAYVGQLLASLCMIFLPDKIALTGGTAEAGTVLLDAVTSRFEAIAGEYHRTFIRLMPEAYSGVEIVLGESKGETGVLGAVVELLDTVS